MLSLYIKSKRHFSYLKTSLNKSQLKVAVIGSGPSGFYLSKMILMKYKDLVNIDIYDKLPHPFGLIRTGIAPDHQEMKQIQYDFLRFLMENHNINLLCNVEITNQTQNKDEKPMKHDDFSWKQEEKDSFHHPLKVPLYKILSVYSFVILSCGAEGEVKLNLPHSNQSNIIYSRDFVSWYNGSIESSIDSKINEIDFSKIRKIIILGNGNVSIDICRLLSKSIASLMKYDIPSHVIEKLKYKNVDLIYVVGRRGTIQSAFSTKEARQLSEVASLFMLKNEAERSKNLNSLLELDTNVLYLKRLLNRKHEFISSNMKIIENLNDIPCDPINDTENKEKKVNIIFRYLISPIKLVSEEKTNKIKEIIFKNNKLKGEPFKQTSEIDECLIENNEKIPTDLVIVSMGYKPKTLFDKYFEYEDDTNIILNSNGLVKYKENKVFTSGWMKRGAKGILDETLRDAQQTFMVISNMIFTFDNIEALNNKENHMDFKVFMKKSNEEYDFIYDSLFEDSLFNKDYEKRLITKEKFCFIKEFEEKEGKKHMKINEKIVKREEMIRIANKIKENPI